MTLARMVTTSLCLLLCVYYSAATTVLINDIGDMFFFVHKSGNPLWLVPGASGVLRICLVLTDTHPCLQGQQHSSRCNAITPDCRCYTWMNTISDNQCVDLPYTPTTKTLLPQWQLLQRPSVYAAPHNLANFYAILHARFPAYSLPDFLSAVCSIQTAPIQLPPPCTVEHAIPLQRMAVYPVTVKDLSKAIGVVCALVLVVPLLLIYISFDNNNQ